MKENLEVEEYKKVPAMSPAVVHNYLREIGQAWQGKGVAVELGSWLGGTAVPLLEGLVKSGYNRPFYAFDRWQANIRQVGKAEKKGIKIKDGQNLEQLFLKNTMSVYSNIKSYKGEIIDTIKSYPGEPIEICLFDAPKRDPIFSIAIDALAKYWIPGTTVLGLLDYYFYLRKPKNLQARFIAPVEFIESHKNHFTKIAEWPKSTESVFFRYDKKI